MPLQSANQFETNTGDAKQLTVRSSAEQLNPNACLHPLRFAICRAVYCYERKPFCNVNMPHKFMPNVDL
ncbi:hypothetical protein OUZ56_013141 [Daphnia magna]|uniref:Uncharacterized protein n=1 Tax=Daphnia magna TaxID=35525 RepID=A0ABQ9Z506_9CRUS|nr:hypothetical protein OUZ56_013141 [Daphnia magna]